MEKHYEAMMGLWTETRVGLLQNKTGSDRYFGGRAVILGLDSTIFR